MTRRRKTYKEILYFTLLIVITLILTTQITKQFPNVSFEYSEIGPLNSSNEYLVIKNKEHICTAIYTFNLSIDTTTIDYKKPYTITISYTREGNFVETYMGLTPTKLKKLFPGENIIGKSEFGSKTKIVYFKRCFNAKKIEKLHKENKLVGYPEKIENYHIIVQNELLIQSLAGAILVFIAMFLLIDGFLSMLKKLLPKTIKNNFTFPN